MRPSLLCTLTLAFVFCFSRVSGSAPITVRPAGTFGGLYLGQNSNYPQTISPPDPEKGTPGGYGMDLLNTWRLTEFPGQSTPGWNYHEEYSSHPSYNPSSYHQDDIVFKSSFYKGDFEFRVGFTGKSPADYPSIVFHAQITTSFSKRMASNISGYIEGQVTSSELRDWSPNSGIPYDVLAQYLDPSRLTLTGTVGGGGQNTFGIILNVDTSRPPLVQAAPEPTTLAFLGIIVGGLVLRARQKG